MGNRQVNPKAFVECDASEDINYVYSVETETADLGEIMRKIDGIQNNALHSYKTHIHAALSYLLNADAALHTNRIRVYLLEHNRTRVLRIVVGKVDATTSSPCIYRKGFLHLLFGVVVGMDTGGIAGRDMGR